jgi:pimeloyl-ACP methyl ester carboxylesterase
VKQRLGEVELRDGRRVTFAVAGEGLPLLYVPGWVSHLEHGWALPGKRRFYEAFATGRTLIRYDRPGCGLSSPELAADDLIQSELEVIEAVIDQTRVSRFDLAGASLGAPLAAAWAAHRPDTVNRLVLYGGWAQGERLADPAVRAHVLGLVGQHWGLGSDLLTDVFAPDADAGLRATFARYQRDSATPEAAQALLNACYELDVTGLLGQVAAPALVLHRREDRAVPLAQGRALSEGIPGATFADLPGRTHLPWAGDADAVVHAMRAHLGLPAAKPLRAPELTKRQYEVAGLVAAGMTNRQIAEQLVITERSAESHLERIRDRLGFRSRAQVAAWYVAVSADGKSAVFPPLNG